MKPTLTYLKAQISILDTAKKEELLKFLSAQLNSSSNNCDNYNNRTDGCIDSYVEYVADFIPESYEVMIQGLQADITSLGITAHKDNK